MTEHFMSYGNVAERLGITPGALGSATLPEPDVYVGSTRGWRTETIDAWILARPGSGVGAGRPRTPKPIAGRTLAHGATWEPMSLAKTRQAVTAIANAAGPKHASLIWFLATTGARLGEACQLTVGDIVEDAGLVNLPAGKTRAHQSSVPRDVLDMLDLTRNADVPLFPSATGGHLQSDNWRVRVFNPAADTAGFPQLRVANLRQTALVWEAAGIMWSKEQ